MKIHSAALLGLTAGVVTLASDAQGAPVYGNFSGPNVTYQAVTETPVQLPGPSPMQLFGTPVLSGDALMFTPANFATGSSGGGLVFQDGHLSMSIVPTTPKGTLGTLSLTEGGGWTVAGGTSATSAQETFIINQLFITSVNGSAVAPIVVPATITFTDANSGTASVTKTPDSIQFNSSGGISSGSWNATATFNFPAALASAGDSGSVTGLSLNLDDELAATSESSSVAYIDKKFFNVVTTGVTVPEPATGSAMLFGIAGILGRRARRRNLVTASA